MLSIAFVILLSTMKPVSWTELAPGIWKSQIGSDDRPTLMDASESRPRKDRISTLPSGRLPFDLRGVQGASLQGYSSIQIPLQSGEKIYGLGLQMEGCDRRGGVYHLRVDHFAQGHDRLHAPTPLYVSSLGYAVFFNTSRPINVYVGVGNRLDDPNRPKFRDRNTDPKWDAQPDSGCVEASVEGGGLETEIFAGPSAMQALQRYNLFVGG